MQHQPGVIIVTLAAVILCGCPRRFIDLCSGADVHPECPNAMTTDMAVVDARDADATSDLGAPDMPADTILPCGGDCSAPTPVCDAASGECVECVETGDCASGVCAADLRCVECVDNTDCAAGVCNTTDNTCVECLTNNECTSTTASLCDTATNTCAACAASADCAHLTDTAVCDAGACVECLDTDADTRATCAGSSCDPATNTCTQTATASLSTCDYCVADSECPANYRCVPMEFQGTPRNAGVGGYCLRRFDMMACPNPYRTLLNRPSLSGAAPEDYCGIVEMNATCEAVRALEGDLDCVTAADCGDPNLTDGRCENVAAQDKCTYTCGADLECPASRPCGNNDFFCGGM